MAVKSSKNTEASTFFQASLKKRAKELGKKQKDIAAEFGISPGNLGDYLSGTKAPSLAVMETLAGKLGANLVDMLAEGRALLEGEALPEVEVTPAIDLTSSREMELLRKLELANDRLEQKDRKIEELERQLWDVKTEAVGEGGQTAGGASTLSASYQKAKVG